MFKVILGEKTFELNEKTPILDLIDNKVNAYK